jgi:hypothetical protein
MNIAQIENNIQQLLTGFSNDTFIYDLLLAYGQPRSSVTRLQQGGLNLSNVPGEVAWKKKLLFKTAENEDVQAIFDAIKTDPKATKHDPRFVIVTDFETLLALDRKTSDSLDIPLTDLPKHFDFFLPLVGMEKAQHQNENPADVKAAERMAKLYDEIKKDNPTETSDEVHNLNVFLSRLLFCFFAEDTGIFAKGQFTNAISSHTQPDGSDLHDYLDTLFAVMNMEAGTRSNLPAYLDAFPYVNGGLFRNPHHAPLFTRRSRQSVIDSGELDWAAINPDIFGSMIQAVITPEHRGGLGMHYTSVPNIMKVIEPLFLNELYEEFEAAKGNKTKLNALLKRIWKIKIFDPACGSGNFLIIAYKELRRLEMRIFKELQTFAFSEISLGNFYGIELDDFAHEVAILSLWLAEHQMNQEFFAAFGRTKPALPLTETGNIVHGNACRVDWELVCPKIEGDEIYILGNPPYLGFSIQNKDQKDDILLVFGEKIKLDYISCWFIKGSQFIAGTNSKYAFVTTNSICQGEQVALLWPLIFDKKLEIEFAYPAFKWENNARGKAAVTCAIIGIRNFSVKKKYLYVQERKLETKNINAYLTAGDNLIITRLSKCISHLPEMILGNSPFDGGYLILNHTEKELLATNNARSKQYLKKFIGAAEFMQGEHKWCLWIDNDELTNAVNIPEIEDRISLTKKMRLESPDLGTNKLSTRPHQFRDRNTAKLHSILVPRVGSSRRKYIPCGFITNEFIIGDSTQAIYDSELYIFSILSSLIHLTWVRAVAGYLKTDYRYSSVLCYNTFPFPNITDAQKQDLEKHVYRILDEREKHSEKTLAQLYDPEKMPEGLREAHRQNDLAVERCYRSKPFDSDEERLEYLFKLYEQMIAEEKTKGTLFEGAGKKKKK